MSLFNFGNPKISEIHTQLVKLIDLQTTIVKKFNSTIESVQAEREVTQRELNVAVAALVPAGDMQRYEDLAVVLRSDSAPFDCAALAKQWTREDEEGQAEYKLLEAQWGTRQQVAEKVAAAEEELSITKQALAETSTEVEEFEKTKVSIEAHNKKYPNHKIERGNHDQYESTSIWRKLGYWTFLNRGPHAAYLALGKYTENTPGNPDFYEYSDEIEEMRETKEQLSAQNETQQAAHDEVAGIAARMDAIKQAYRGPSGIAEAIRRKISEYLVADEDFAQKLNDQMQRAEARDIGLAVAKIRTFAIIEKNLDTQREHAKATLNDLTGPQDDLANALSRVGGERIAFDIESVKTRVENAAVTSRTNAKLGESALLNADSYRPDAGTSFADMQRELHALGRTDFDSNALDINFSELTNLVSGEVRAYEREQQRLADERARAAREAREAHQRQLDAAARTRSRRTGGDLSDAFGRSTRVSVETSRRTESRTRVSTDFGRATRPSRVSVSAPSRSSSPTRVSARAPKVTRG